MRDPAILGRMNSVDPTVSRRMAATRGRDTRPELELRRLLHARGLRYRVNARVLPLRTVDIAFTRARVAVLVDGCFWHRCPAHYVPPKKRADWWEAKIAGNVARDLETTRLLTDLGWTVLRCWEHEDPADVADRVEREVRTRRASA